jgi:hypothetical protein
MSKRDDTQRAYLSEVRAAHGMAVDHSTVLRWAIKLMTVLPISSLLIPYYEKDRMSSLIFYQNLGFSMIGEPFSRATMGKATLV